MRRQVSPALVASVLLCGAERGRGWTWGRGRGDPARPGALAPSARRGRVRPGVGAHSSKKGKTKSFGGQGLPGRLSRNSSRRLLTEIYQVLYGSVIPLPAVVSISSWSQLICCDSCPQQFSACTPLAPPTPSPGHIPAVLRTRWRRREEAPGSAGRAGRFPLRLPFPESDCAGFEELAQCILKNQLFLFQPRGELPFSAYWLLAPYPFSFSFLFPFFFFFFLL